MHALKRRAHASARKAQSRPNHPIRDTLLEGLLTILITVGIRKPKGATIYETFVLHDSRVLRADFVMKENALKITGNLALITVRILMGREENDRIVDVGRRRNVRHDEIEKDVER